MLRFIRRAGHGLEDRDGVHHLTTPGGTVRTRAVALATAGYTPPGLSRFTKHRLMPILSNSIVTRPLEDDEKRLVASRPAHRLPTPVPFAITTDTCRMAVCRLAAAAPSPVAMPRIPSTWPFCREGFYRKFPALAGIDLDYSWWGWVDVSHDMMPRIFQPDKNEQIYYAMGYGGNA